MTKPKTRTESLRMAAQGVRARKRQVNTAKLSKRAERAVIEPTAERLAKGVSYKAGMATQFDAPINKLLENGHLTNDEYAALAWYADQSRLADKSTMRDSCDFSVRGNGGGEPSAAIVSARINTALMENRAGTLVSILRAIVRDEQSLTEYCIAKHGGRERLDDKGAFVAMVPKGERRVMAEARADLRAVAERILK